MKNPEETGRRGVTNGGELAGRALGTVFALALFAAVAGAQAANLPAASLSRALDLEGAGKCREAIPLYRESVRAEDPVGAILGLERCYAQVGGSEAILPLVDSLLVRRPKDPTLRTVMLRTLISLRRDADADVAFARWTAAAPREPAPYREYARLLLDAGRATAADTVLRAAANHLGGTRELAAEFAQMQGALGLWLPSARSWREASVTLPYLEQAAVFALATTPDTLRDSVRTIFLAPPIELGARRILASLEGRWRSMREGWRVLESVPPTDSVVQAWIRFGEDAELNEAWLTARDAFAAAAGQRPRDLALALRAATAAIAGGEPSAALELLAPVAASGDAAVIATAGLLRVRALGALGRAAEVETLLESGEVALDDQGRRQAQRTLAWAWIRSGDVNRARRALAAGGGGTEEDDRIEAWLALYDGDLKTARRGLRRTDETSRDVVTAMALLSRTRADSAAGVGASFLALARGDTAGAARRFETTAGDLADAAPFLLLLAARLHAASADTARAVSLWQTLVEQHVDAPEAAEAELDWARFLRRQGNVAAAIDRLEHLMLTYPQSALVPQARRELELARGAIPPGREDG